jgi:hypothetical protein
MPKLEFTPAEIKEYVSGRRTHCFHKRCKEVAEDLRVHAEGIFPAKMIEERRPNEPSEVLEYRKKIYIPKTKPYFGKIESTLQKIRRSSDWSVRYDLAEFTRIPEEENLETYCEKRFPVFGSVTNWAFASLLRQYLIDPNSIVVVMPREIPTEGTQYYRPEPFIFESEQVLDYEHGDFAFLKDKIGCLYLASGKYMRGESYWAITTQSIIRYDQINGKREFAESYRFDYDHGMLPVIHMGGVIVESFGPWIFRESRVAGIVPEFNEAARENSDLQAAKVAHLYPERWEYTNNECANCKGTGRIMDRAASVPCEVTCTTCHGGGYVVAGPYSKIMIKPPNSGMGESATIPTPPAGFVEKDVEIIKVQEESVDKHIYNGLASISLEFTMQSPLAQSGVAKATDQDGANNTVHSVAEDIVAIMDDVYFWVAMWRYGMQYDITQIEEMCPRVAVPEKYDIFTSTMYQEQFKAAKDSKMNPVILNMLEAEYANKAFNNDPGVRDRVELVLSLDPLANISEDDKMSRLSNNGITKESYIISSNINAFVERAIEDNASFVTLDITAQKEVIKKYAAEQLAATAAEVIPQVPEEEEEIVVG